MKKTLNLFILSFILVTSTSILALTCDPKYHNFEFYLAEIKGDYAICNYDGFNDSYKIKGRFTVNGPWTYLEAEQNSQHVDKK